MKKLMLIAVLAASTALLSGCNLGRNNCRSWTPSWFGGDDCSPCSAPTTAYEPATPYVDGGYMVPPASMNELPAPN